MMELMVMLAAMAMEFNEDGRIENCKHYFELGKASSDGSVNTFADFLLRVCEVGIRNAILDKVMDSERPVDSKIIELISNDNKESNDKQTLVICISAGKQILQARYGI